MTPTHDGAADAAADGAAARPIDSHCHLDRFPPEVVPDLLQRARLAGLGGMVTIGTRLSEAQRQIGLCDHATPDLPIWCTIGTHPDHAADEALPTPEALAALTAPPCVIGIGESGLDYLHGAPAMRAAQQASFRAHIRAARLAGLPLVIHAREADADIAAILQDEHDLAGPFAFLLHCFSSGAELARLAIALGGSISFSGILTFPRSDTVRDIARTVPRDRLLVETDAPFLAPVPRRGKPNEPAFVIHTLAILAGLHGLAASELAAQTSRNFHALFRKAV